MRPDDIEWLDHADQEIDKGKDTTTDAVFGEITEDGPNYRGVSIFN